MLSVALEPMGDKDALTKRQLLAQVNASIRELADASETGPVDSEFICECGADGCREHVHLSLDAYAALHDNGFPVLAPGHTVSERARSERLRKDAEALRAQAEQQLKRARRILGKD